jgi:hypothetical protein
MSQFDLKTGDILLFSYGGKSLFSSLIKSFTHSEFTHVGMVLKDPKFIHPSLKGYYVWESGLEDEVDPQDGKKKLGVQITPFEEIYQNYANNNSQIYVRRVSDESPFNDTILGEIHKVVYDKPYDIVPADFIEALFRKDHNKQKTSRFWCSALLGYIYTQVGILNSDTDWSMLRPCDFSSSSEYLQFKISLSDNIKIL